MCASNRKLPMKTCTKCKETKDLSDFNKNSATKDGRFAWCRSCAATRKSAYNSSVHGRAKTLLYVAQMNAKRCGVPFDLRIEDIVAKLEAGVCEVTGLRLTFERSTETYRSPRSASLDRIDSQGGYTTGNVRVVCWQYNLARNEYGDEALNELVEALYRKKTISSQAPRGEGSTAIPKGSRGRAVPKRTPSRVDDDIAYSAR